ncbi:hypothetical protein BDF22DRAFT_682718 [Syncephalis plumigaleata]|nr:hypothetical protein BDF22DRAFT_682718 [Syncephalis plumigaleata]
MKFTLVPPPFAPHCDFTMNVTDCEDEFIHFVIFIISTIIHGALILMGIYIFTRYRDGNGGGGGMMSASNTCCGRFIGQPMKTMSVLLVVFLTARVVYNTLCQFDVIESFPIRALLMPWSYVFGFWGILAFASGIIETVQMTINRMPHIHSCRTTRRLLALTPPRILAQCASVILGLAGFVAPGLYSYVGGLHAIKGDWEGYFAYIRLGWCIWGIICFILGALYCYYAIVLTVILRKLLPSTVFKNHLRNSPEMANNRPSKDSTPMHITSIEATESAIIEAELSERSQGITRLRRTLLHLLYCYLVAAVTSFLWGIGLKDFVFMPMITRSFWVLDQIVIWPVAVGGVLWYRWQMERARERREQRRAASSNSATVWPTSPAVPNGDHV